MRRLGILHNSYDGAFISPVLQGHSYQFRLRGGPPGFWKYPLLAIEYAVTPYSELEKEGMERRTWFSEL